MSGVCCKCANEITGESVRCEGFCSSEVCLRCSGMSNAMYTSMQANAHCVWLCTACKNLLAKARFSNALVSTSAVNDTIVESLKTEIKDSILAEIRTEIRENFKTLTPAVPIQPCTHQQQPAVGNDTKKRPRDFADSSPGNAAKRSATTQGVATRTDEEADMFPSASVAEESVQLFWLYMRGFRPDVAEERVSQWVQSKLETNDIKVHKLIPRGRDVRELTFVSFKVGMPMDLKNKALCKQTWPNEIRCREFENTSQSGFDPDSQLQMTAPAQPVQPVGPTVVPTEVLPDTEEERMIE